MANERQIVREAAQRYGINPATLWGVYGAETSFGRDLSTSSAGAIGPFQFLPSTARSMGVNPNDFRSAAFGAARYLSQYKGRGLAGMLSAYNAGPAGGLQPGYVKSVERSARNWGGGPSPREAATGGRSSSSSGASATYTPGALRLGIQQGEGGTNPQILAQLTSLLQQSEAPARASLLPTPAGLEPALALPTGAKPLPVARTPEPSIAEKITPLLEKLNVPGLSSVTSEGREPGTLSLSTGANALTGAVPHGTKLRGFLPGNAQLVVKRIDQGQDLQTNPGGPILAPGSGHVIAVPYNPGGFGISYPVVHFDSGPLAGHDVYIGHTRSALPVGAHFGAGAVLGRTQHGSGPYAGNASTPGWAEIGLWPPGSMSAGRRIAPLLGLRA